MSKQYIMAVDQGTTGSRVFFFDHDAQMVSSAYQEIKQLYPQLGWVEHDPMEDWNTVITCMNEAMQKGNIKFEDIAGIGITNQRETAMCWYKDSGKPVYNAIIWASRQSTEICEQWKATPGMRETVHQHTGLPIDPWFSASKVRWIIDNVDGVRDEMLRGNVCFGNIDSWLFWNFTKGAQHIEEYSNAARSMMLNLHTNEWDYELLEMYGIPDSICMPKLVPSAGIMCYTHPDLTGGIEIPIAGCLGDQQSGTFGQNSYQLMTGKITYGTAGVVDINIGDKPVLNDGGVPTTLGWKIGDKTTYLNEAGVFTVGAMIQWLRDGIKLIKTAPESGERAAMVPDNGDVYVVNALTGLCSPYLEPYARGTIVGLTAGSTAEHIIRATMEGICYSILDNILPMERAIGQKLAAIRCDGGACNSDFLMQFQADIAGCPVMRPTQVEMTVLGAAYIGGIGVGFWSGLDEVSKFWKLGRQFDPTMSEDQRMTLYSKWLRAIERAKYWAAADDSKLGKG